MVRLELTEKEAGLLSEIMGSYLSDLRGEIVATENKEWRADMKEREIYVTDINRRLLSQLG